MSGRRTLGVLLVVFIALAAATLWQANQPATTPTPAPQDVFLRVFPEIASAGSIAAVRLQDPNNGSILTLVRDTGGAWQVDGIEAQLQPEAGEQIATTIALLPFQQTLPLDDNTTLADFGFENNGTLLVQAVLENGEGHVVAVGGLSPSGTTYYALVDDREEIYLLQRGAVDFLIVQLRTPPFA